MNTQAFRLSMMALALLIAGCAVGPDYKRPTVETPSAYKEDPLWTSADPKDLAPRGAWWEVFGDPTLNELAAKVASAKQDIQQAQAQYRQALAAVSVTRAAYAPTIDADASTQRSRSVSSSSSKGASIGNSHSLSLQASWEADLWGKISRGVESDTATAQASAATLAATRLSAEAALVQNYLQLRVTDELIASQAGTVEAYQKALQLTQNQFAAEQISRADVAQAQSQLQTAKATLIDYGIQRSQYEHAIAILIGISPAEFSLAATPLQAQLPVIPPALPSTLLERRPDIAAAERKVAAANAQIGVNQAARFPALSFSSSAGFSSALLSPWLSLPNRVWSLGASLSQSLFDGGARNAKVDESIAAYDAAVASYRQTVLTSFQEVEDNLVALRLLKDEIVEQTQAVDAAREAQRIAMNQYRAGMTAYTDVITTQNALNSAERSSLQLVSRQYVSSVALIKALGGGWQGSNADSPVQ